MWLDVFDVTVYASCRARGRAVTCHAMYKQKALVDGAFFDVGG